MNKDVLKDNKGITIISLIITIIVMAIISGVALNVSRNRLKINDIKKMVNDIEYLNDKISNYYLKYGGLPILKQNGNNIKYTYTSLNFDKDSNDNENYYIIDLEAIGNITLNYGKDGFDNPNQSDDVYIINEKTHTVYYVKGIEFTDRNLYHSTRLDESEYNAVGPTKPEIKVLSEKNNKFEVEIIPGKDKVSGIQKTEYFIKSTDFQKNVTQTESTQINKETIISDLSVNKAYEITAVTTSNSGITSEKTIKIRDWIAKVEIGDYVNYEELLSDVTIDENSEIINHLSTYSGNTDANENTPSKISQEKSLRWRVYDVKNGNLRLISSEATESQVTFESYDGYNNVVYLLDEICGELYNSDKGMAKNIKTEDVLNHSNFDYTQYVQEIPNEPVEYGATYEYENHLKYPNIFSSEITCKGIDGETGVDNNNGTIDISEQPNLISGLNEASTRLRVMHTYWGKTDFVEGDFTDPMYYTLLINNGLNNYSSYWFSSRVNSCGGMIYYSVRRYQSTKTKIDSVNLYFSNNENESATMGLRPIVTLNPNIKLSGSSVEGWEIQ